MITSQIRKLQFVREQAKRKMIVKGFQEYSRQKI